MIRYEKTIWENDKTPVNAQHLGKVEDGLEYLFDVIKDVPAGEDARIASEKQRQVNETTRQNNELKRNDTLNVKVKEVDNAIAASNSNIEEVKNKFETIIASKQQDAEVILARGKYSSLPTRLDNLDKDLLNVKDTAIIPVATENNFVTVEETVNGYFKNFKLEGKTLVNIYNAASKADEELQLKISQNTIKTFSNTVTVVGVNKPISIGVFKDNVWVRDIDIPSLPHLLKLNEGEYVDTIVGLKSKGWTSNDFNDFKKIFVVSGDYVKNPPRFFEGMKSVGDDAEEIVVSSFNSGKFIIKNIEKDKFIDYKTGNTEFTSSWGSSDFIEVQEGLPIIQSICYNSQAGGIAFYDSNKEYVSGVNANKTVGDFKINTPKNARYFRCCDKLDKIKVYFGNKNEIENICKVDKKKILYYDADTQAWKKPILREWDSIEKYSDGKYYYHKRSEERVYQENDETNLEIITDKTNTVYKLEKEKVYECTPIDLISYENETNYMIECGVVIPKSSFKYEGNVGNVINTLKEKVSHLENKLYKTNLANFTVALNALDTKLKLEQLTKAPK